MREILFRGKTKAISGSPYNNGKAEDEWVKGHLYNDVGCWKIRQFETNYADYIPYEVDPETIGQYTGLTDKNGEKIFEGDILKFAYNEEDKNPIFYSVEWKGDRACFGYAETADKIIEVDCLHCEIIGNIHDNPELLRTPQNDEVRE